MNRKIAGALALAVFVAGCGGGGGNAGSMVPAPASPQQASATAGRPVHLAPFRGRAELANFEWGKSMLERMRYVAPAESGALAVDVLVRMRDPEGLAKYALSTSDPVLRSLAPSTRLAESAVTVSLERSITVYSTEGRWALDAVPFVQYSERHRSVDITLPEPTNPQAMLIGIGWRRVRNQPTQAPLRLDIAKTVWLSGGLPNRWVFVLSTQPWLAFGRNRDGLREIVR